MRGGGVGAIIFNKASEEPCTGFGMAMEAPECAKPSSGHYIPTLGIARNQGLALQAALRASRGNMTATVGIPEASRLQPYGHMSGTSMCGRPRWAVRPDAALPPTTLDRARARRLCCAAGRRIARRPQARRPMLLTGRPAAAATPHAAAVAGIVWAAFPRCTSEEVRLALQARALDLGPRGRDDRYGFGLVQVISAAAAADPLADCEEGWRSSCRTASRLQTWLPHCT
jgi:hypothetical protein